MTAPKYEVVVTLVDGEGHERSRTFTSGLEFPPVSVGSQGDWRVSAQDVASVHLWLRFDGERLFASAAPGSPAYLQNMRIGNAWHEVTDRSELRFGQARMNVFCRPVEAFSSVRPPAPARVEPRHLTPIERAAALPLPSFFSERLRDGRDPSPNAPEPRPARFGEPRRVARRNVARAGAGSSRDRRARWPWVLLFVSAAGLPFTVGFLWVTHFGHHPAVPAASTASTASTASAAGAATPPPPAPAASAPLAEQHWVEPASAKVQAPPPTVEATGMPLPTVVEALAPTKSLSSTPLKAYPQNLADKPVPRLGADPSLISEEWRAHHERQLHAPNRTRAKVIFLGDSITEGWSTARAYQDSFGKYSPLNLGLAGDVTQNVLWRIEHGALTGTNPEVLVLMIGVNNLAGGFSAQDTVAGIRAILVAVQSQLPNTQILLLAILPARPSPADPLRQRIVEANRLLGSVPLPPRVSIHDVGSVLLEPDGTVSKATLRDFVHPTAAGYERLSEAVAPLIEALMGHAAE